MSSAPSTDPSEIGRSTPRAAPAQAAPYDRLYVFGDSLLDSGNLYALAGTPTSPPYAQRFTDGPTSIEYYASGAGLS